MAKALNFIFKKIDKNKRREYTKVHNYMPQKLLWVWMG